MCLFLLFWKQITISTKTFNKQQGVISCFFITAAAGSSEHMENDPLLPQLERVRDYLSHYTETIGDFYSPMESPLGKTVKLNPCQIIEWASAAMSLGLVEDE